MSDVRHPAAHLAFIFAGDTFETERASLEKEVFPALRLWCRRWGIDLRTGGGARREEQRAESGEITVLVVLADPAHPPGDGAAIREKLVRRSPYPTGGGEGRGAVVALVYERETGTPRATWTAADAVARIRLLGLQPDVDVTAARYGNAPGRMSPNPQERLAFFTANDLPRRVLVDVQRYLAAHFEELLEKFDDGGFPGGERRDELHLRYAARHTGGGDLPIVAWDAVRSAIAGNDDRIVVLFSPRNEACSAVLAALSEDPLVAERFARGVFHFPLAGPGEHALERVLRRLGGAETGAIAAGEVELLAEAFLKSLHRPGETSLLAVDRLEAIEERGMYDGLRWLPERLPPGVKMVVGLSDRHSPAWALMQERPHLLVEIEGPAPWQALLEELALDYDDGTPAFAAALAALLELGHILRPEEIAAALEAAGGDGELCRHIWVRVALACLDTPDGLLLIPEGLVEEARSRGLIAGLPSRDERRRLARARAGEILDAARPAFDLDLSRLQALRGFFQSWKLWSPTAALSPNHRLLAYLVNETHIVVWNIPALTFRTRLDVSDHPRVVNNHRNDEVPNIRALEFVDDSTLLIGMHSGLVLFIDLLRGNSRREFDIGGAPEAIQWTLGGFLVALFPGNRNGAFGLAEYVRDEHGAEQPWAILESRRRRRFPASSLGLYRLERCLQPSQELSSNLPHRFHCGADQKKIFLAVATFEETGLRSRLELYDGESKGYAMISEEVGEATGPRLSAVTKSGRIAASFSRHIQLVGPEGGIEREWRLPVKGFDPVCREVALAPDDSQVYLQSKRSGLIILRPETKDFSAIFESVGLIEGIYPLSTDKLLLLSHRRGTIGLNIVDVERGEIVRRLTVGVAELDWYSLDFTPRGRLVVGCRDGQVHVFEPEFTSSWSYSLPSGPPWRIISSSSGETFVVCSMDNINYEFHVGSPEPRIARHPVSGELLDNKSGNKRVIYNPFVDHRPWPLDLSPDYALWAPGGRLYVLNDNVLSVRALDSAETQGTSLLHRVSLAATGEALALVGDRLACLLKSGELIVFAASAPPFPPLPPSHQETSPVQELDLLAVGLARYHTGLEGEGGICALDDGTFALWDARELAVCRIEEGRVRRLHSVECPLVRCVRYDRFQRRLAVSVDRLYLSIRDLELKETQRIVFGPDGASMVVEGSLTSHFPGGKRVGLRGTVNPDLFRVFERDGRPIVSGERRRAILEAAAAPAERK